MNHLQAKAIGCAADLRDADAPTFYGEMMQSDHIARRSVAPADRKGLNAPQGYDTDGAVDDAEL